MIDGHIARWLCCAAGSGRRPSTCGRAAGRRNASRRGGGGAPEPLDLSGFRRLSRSVETRWGS